MIKKDTTSRRKFTKKLCAVFLSTTSLSGILTSCGTPEKETPKDPCLDLSELNDKELAVREQLGYTAQSSFSDRTCLNCQLFVKPDNSLPCGNCLAMKGPVADEGYCTVWAPAGVG